MDVKILIVHDTPDTASRLTSIVKDAAPEGNRHRLCVSEARNESLGRRLFEENNFDIVIVDAYLTLDVNQTPDGPTLISAFKDLRPEVYAILVSARMSIAEVGHADQFISMHYSNRDYAEQIREAVRDTVILL